MFCGIVTLIMRRSWFVLRSPSSSSATGSRTTDEVASLANDSICACVYAEPWLMSDPLEAVRNEK